MPQHATAGSAGRHVNNIKRGNTSNECDARENYVKSA